MVTHDSKSDLHLVRFSISSYKKILSVEEEAVEQKKKTFALLLPSFFMRAFVSNYCSSINFEVSFSFTPTSPSKNIPIASILI